MPDKYAVHLTEERLVEYMDAYSSFDEDGKGRIPCEVVIPCMRKVGLMPSDCELEELLKAVDTENNILAEGVSYEQFCQMSAMKEKDIFTEEDILNAFRMFDENADGFLSMQMLMQILCTRGEKLTEPEIAALINTSGPDQDGHINYEDFVHRLMSRD